MSDFEVTKVSDREVVIRTKNCATLKRTRDLVKKAGLDIDPKFICEEESRNFPELYKEFGVDITGWELEENGCVYTAKLK